MPSKLRKALGAVKDQTSISLAKVSDTNYSNLKVAILKATTHEELPVEDRFINEVLLLTSSSKIYSAACVHALARRISRTRNWIVVLKSLSLIFRILQEGDSYFTHEVLSSIKRGSSPLNLSKFRDESNASSPWDFTSFVRTFALYLDERLDCTLMGKLNRLPPAGSYCHRRLSLHNAGNTKPTILLDKILYWQRLLDRVLATRPTGAAKNNRLVQISVYTVVRESFDLYRDISDGLAVVLDSFFRLQYKSCIEAFHACCKAAKQFDELASFYSLCRNLGIGRSPEYPSVQKISEKLLDTLDEFLKDKQQQPSLPPPKSKNKPRCQLLRLPAPPLADPDLKKPNSKEKEKKEENMIDAKADRDLKQPNSPSPSKDEEKEQREQEDLIDVMETNASISSNNSCLDLVLFNDPSPPTQQTPPQQKEEQITTAEEGRKDGWEMVLVESATNMSKHKNYHLSNGGGFDSELLDSLYEQASLYQHHQYYHHNYSNPFLQSNGFFSTFSLSSPRPPTFGTSNPEQHSTLQQYWLQH
ncbi:clathrin coat assembly protein AP180-like [Tasmannia lanceolata]|uniref:clathrin coat assembly protein AP180-like n=1 Tax=Tasmannia lanceolata TaxID=3420 RepID=UPI0040638FB6